MRRLIREGNPPSGQLASPVPQYWNPNTEDFEDVLGAHGAPRAILYGPNGQPISSSNRLPVDAAVAGLETLATAAKQDLAKGVLDAISGKVATQTTAAAILTKLADLATEDTLDDVKTAAEALAELIDSGALKTTLTGQKAAQTILPREIRAAGTSAYRRTVTPPIDAKGCRLELAVFGVTGQFGSGEGISLLYREQTDAIPTNLVDFYETTKTRGTGNDNQHLIMVYPGLSGANGGVFLKVDGVLGRRLVAQVNINGTFAAGEGFDCQLDVVWIM